MPTTQHQKQFEPFAFPFDIPSEEAFRVQMSDHDFRALLLGGLAGVAEAAAGGGGVAPTPALTTHNITAVVSTLMTLATGRRALVYNHGAGTVTVSFGPVDAVANAGSVTLGSGDAYETPVAFVGKITAITISGTAVLAVTLF